MSLRMRLLSTRVNVPLPIERGDRRIGRIGVSHDRQPSQRSQLD